MSGLADIQLVLSEPPSANRIWRQFRGRMTKSPEYREWKDAQATSIAHQLGGDCALEWFGVAITLPTSRRDPDNSIKPIMDALQAGGAVRNDRMLRHLSLKVDEDREPGTVAIAVWAATAPKPKPKKRRARK
jgi:Holliday junction resolvase RusA-like endonuclease